MLNKRISIFLFFTACFTAVFAYAQVGAVKDNISEMVLIPSKSFIPFFKSEGEDAVVVDAFYLDKYPVTNAEFLEFVKKNPKWMKNEPPLLFADTGYLQQWRIENEVLEDFKLIRNSPVTNVSWHAAKAYCLSQGKRLPSVIEWEYAASAPILNDDRSIDKIILEWYSKPAQVYIDEVGSGTKNEFGLRDMHGLIWEWVDDFNSIIVDSDSRSKIETVNHNLFCPSGSFGTPDREDYTSFMRFAFRSNLKSNYTIDDLGFRCAKDTPDGED